MGTDQERNPGKFEDATPQLFWIVGNVFRSVSFQLDFDK
jgi:hypothetical protein